MLAIYNRKFETAIGITFKIIVSGKRFLHYNFKFPRKTSRMKKKKYKVENHEVIDIKCK